MLRMEWQNRALELLLSIHVLAAEADGVGRRPEQSERLEADGEEGLPSEVREGAGAEPENLAIGFTH